MLMDEEYKYLLEGFTLSEVRGYLLIHMTLHRFLWRMIYGPIPDDMQIDHINGDRGDNRLANLRLMNAKEHRMMHGKRIRNASKGYWFAKERNKWIAQVVFNGVTYYLGAFDTEDEAKEARRIAVEQIENGTFIV